MIGSNVVMNQPQDEEVGDLTEDEMDIDEVMVNMPSNTMQSIETNFQNVDAQIENNIAKTIQAQLGF